MRLAVVETSPFGGLLHYSVQLADALARRGHMVEVIAPRNNELRHHAGAAVMRPVLTRTVRGERQPSLRAAYLARRGMVAVRLARAWLRILVEVPRGRYDAVITGADISLPISGAAALALTSLPGRAPIAFISHNTRNYNRWSRDGLYRPAPLLLRLVMPRFERVFVHGGNARRELLEQWPDLAVGVIPHGDERIFGEEPPAPAREERVLFFGEWRKVKGMNVLMDAFDELAARRPSARLTIAGTPIPSDFDPDLVRRWAAAHGDKVTVVDRYVPLEEVRDVFAQSRVVVTPYLTGSQSGVVHLAMTMSRPVVTADVGDLATAIAHGETGLVVPPGHAPALASALEEVLSDPARAEQMGRQGRTRVLTDSGWETVAAQVEAEISSLIDR